MTIELVTRQPGSPVSESSHHINGIPVIGTAPKKDAKYWTEWNLENWVRILNMKALALGLPKQAVVGENYTSLDLDGDRSYDEMCYRLADDTALVIAALPEAERQAVRHRYLGEKYEFWRLEVGYGLALASAIPMVTEGLRRRGVYLG